MALPSGQGSDQDFIATVAVKVDPATLDAAGAQIRDTLRKATSDVNLTALTRLVELANQFTAATAKSAAEADKLKQAIDQAARSEDAAGKSRKANSDLLRIQGEEFKILQNGARQLAALEQVSAKAGADRLQSDLARNAALAQARALLAEQTVQLREQAAATNLLTEQTRNALVSPNLGTLAGGLGNNFLSTLLSGGGLNAALSQSLGQLQPALFQVAQGGEAASAAFAKLGIEGVGAVSGLTSGMAALGVAALAVVPVIGAIGTAINGAYEQQKDFVFQSGILAKQLGTTAEEGAKLRALLTLVGQEDNIFAAITLNQIQASVAALDRVNKGLETASPQVEKFGQALTQLGVSYQNNNGSLKTFAELTVDISAGLQKLDTAQRSLAIQNLAGLFGSDVAKIFGFGPEGLTTVLQNAVVVTNEQAKANDNLQVSLATLTAAKTEFNISLTNGLTPLETFINSVKTGAFKEATEGVGDLFARFGVVDLSQLEGRGEAAGQALAKGVFDVFTIGWARPVFEQFFPDESELKNRAARLRELITSLSTGGTMGEPIQLQGYREELGKIEEQLRAIASVRFQGVDKARDITVFEDAAASEAALKKQYDELEDALDATDKAAKELLDTQKEIGKNNLDVAKAFDAQINALQKTADGYDKYYEKVGEAGARIAEIQSKEGKPFTQIGQGTVKDVEKAIVDLRVLEERLAKLDEKQDPGDPRFDQLALNIRRRRAALGLQPGELTDIANVDITIGITGLSKKDRDELNEWFAKLVEYKKEFLQGGFDVTQNTFKELQQSLSGILSQEDFATLLTTGSSALQKYAESLGLFASPGFAQAIGESALKVKLLAGGFGDINTASGAQAAFSEYLKAFSGFREDLVGLSDFIADPKTLTIPIALEFGLVTETDVTLAGQRAAAGADLKDALLEGGAGFGSEVGAAQRAAITNAAQQKIDSLGSQGGIINALLAKYGITPGKAIEATAKFVIDSEVDTTLAKRKADAEADKIKAAENQRTIILKWNFKVEPTLNTAEIRDWLDAQRQGISPTRPGGLFGGDRGGTDAPPIVDQNDPDYRRAAGGDVFRGLPTLVGEEGKPELFIPPTNGRIIPGNDTAALMRMFSGRERLPVPQTINYAPVVNQNLTVDARGTNARDVTQAIKRTQSKSLFTSSSDLVRNRDFLRSRGLN